MDLVVLISVDKEQTKNFWLEAPLVAVEKNYYRPELNLAEEQKE